MSSSTSVDLPEETWYGTSIEDIFRGHGPWGLDTTSSINASRRHAVLYELPITLENPPKPHFSVNIYHWDDDHVRMPYSPKNVLTVVDQNDETTTRPCWDAIQLALLQPIHSSRELEAVIHSYNPKSPKFPALHNFFDSVLEEEEERAEFFERLLPGIIRLALRLPELVPGNIPLLKHGSCKSISLSQLQIASLLANAFLCTFPWRKESTVFCPGINFGRLFMADFRPKREQAVAEKLKCIFHYFNRVLAKEPVGVVTFERKYFPKYDLPHWDRLDNNLGNTKIHISSTGVIEVEGNGMLQVDFANKNVGGGVLGYGCVQEEIRFVICPELIVSRLFTEQLGPTEALVVTGVERYSSYTGYGDEFEWSGNYNDTTPYDSSGRRRTSIVAIDALRFNKPVEQYHSSNILRELNKAYAGFHSRLEGQLQPVATGNWGCGAFRGDAKLKSLIQLMACCAARRDMVYFTFGNTELCKSVHEVYLFLATNQITISQLWKYLCQFSHAKVKTEHLFSYIQQAHFDSKRQHGIKEFFCFGKKKVADKNTPSTSSGGSKRDLKDVNTTIVDGMCSNSEALKLLFGESTESSNSEIIDASPIENIQIDDNVDIIESSQNEERTGNKLFSLESSKQESSSKENKNINLKKMLDDDDDTILDFISAIDADSRKPQKNSKTITSDSLLTSLDNYGKKTKEDVVINIPEEEIVAEQMEIDEIENEGNDKLSLSKKNELGTKRKITDYFSKIDKG